MNLAFCCFSLERLTKWSPKPSLANQFSAIPQGQLNWTGDPLDPHRDPQSLRSGRLQNESFPNFFRIFVPNFAPNFSRIFLASFRGRRRPEKIHQKSPPFFNAKFPGKHEKIFTKCFWSPQHLSTPKSQRFLRFAIAMPIADPRNRSDF